MAGAEGFKWVRISAAIALAISAAAALISASVQRRRTRRLASRVRELEASLEAALEKGAAERRGRVRAQQALRKALAEQSFDGSSPASNSSSSPPPRRHRSYPMVPIGTIQCCFSTRNGTPRQPLLVPLARACLVFDQDRVPPEALEGLADYSHCWIIYVFHLNTDLEKLWKQPARSKFKAKVRVPRLKGGKMGVLATRSPHRPCPIGLTVAKVEAVDGHAILLSGVDLVDGTPVLDIKPYLPYSDCIQGAKVPDWVKAENALAVASISFSVGFLSSLSSCWVSAGKHSLYASVDEFQSLIMEVLSWDIRSLSQQSRPHNVPMDKENDRSDPSEDLENDDSGKSNQALISRESSSSLLSDTIIYHLILEGVDISYKIDTGSNIIVEKATLPSDVKSSKRDRYNYMIWREKLGR